MMFPITAIGFLLVGLGEAQLFTNSSTSTLTTLSTSATKSSSSTTIASQDAVTTEYCLPGYTSSPYTDCQRPGNPQILEGMYNPYEWASWDPPMASSCSKVFQSSYDNFRSTGAIFTSTMSFEDEDGNFNGEVTTYAQYDDWFYYTPQKGSGCCLNCTMYGGDVEVYYWPTSTPSAPFASNATTTASNATQTPGAVSIISSLLVNEANFTFTSPSVYVAFRSLYATDLCGDVGDTYDYTTVGFEPGELMTARAWTWNGSSPAPPYIPEAFSVADWGVIKNCSNITSTFLQDALNGDIYTNYAAAPQSCHTGGCWLDGFTITWDPCKPTLSVPPQLFTLNSLWKNCQTGIPAFFDPPYTLTPGKNGLVQVTMTVPGDPAPTAQPETTGNAQPASTPSTIVTPTSGPTIPPPIPTPTPSQSSKNAQPPPPPPPISSSAGSPSPVVSLDPGQVPTPTILTIGSHTISAGAPSTTISGTTFSLAPSGTALIIDGQTHLLPSPTPAWVVSSQVLTPGSAVVVGGTTYSLPTSGNSVFIDGHPSALPSPNTPSDFVVGGQTVTPGGPAVTISGTTYSIPVGGSSVFINGQPSALPTAQPEFVIGSQTLVAGGSAITVSGTTYSLASSGGQIVVDGTTRSMIDPGLSTYIIGSQTLIAGGSAITVSGIVISLLAGGSSIVVAGTTEAIGGFVAATTTESGTADATKAPTLSLEEYLTPTTGSATGSGSQAAPTKSGGERALSTSWTVIASLFLGFGVLCIALL